MTSHFLALATVLSLSSCASKAPPQNLVRAVTDQEGDAVVLFPTGTKVRAGTEAKDFEAITRQVSKAVPTSVLKGLADPSRNGQAAASALSLTPEAGLNFQGDTVRFLTPRLFFKSQGIEEKKVMAVLPALNDGFYQALTRQGKVVKADRFKKP